MKIKANTFAILVVSSACVLIGCSSPRMVERERYFTPVIRRVQPLAASRPVTQPTEAARPAENDKVLMGALAESRMELQVLRRELTGIRDSLRLIGTAARQQDQFTRLLVDKVAVLEQRLLAAQSAAPVQAPPTNTVPLTQLQRPSSTPSQQGPYNAQRTARPGTTLGAEYTEGVSLFNRKRYDDAKTWFSRLLTMGISEDLADNCEYWVGECDFARGRWTLAVESFERVVALRGSNKRADALLMLGRSLEFLRQSARARSTFEQLVREFPSSSAAGTARRKLRSLRPSNNDQREGSILS